jgi:2Fe-2S ferredoxin
MPTIVFIDAEGPRHEVEARIGENLMTVGREHGLDIEGACEGVAACSTCHLIVDEVWFARLPPADEDEQDMLDLAMGLTRTSRLGCQIDVTEEMDGLVVRLPREIRNMMLD